MRAVLLSALLIGCAPLADASSGIAAGGEGVQSAGEGIKAIGDSAAGWIKEITFITAGAGALGLEWLRRRAGMWKRMAFTKPKNSRERAKFDGLWARSQGS
jgi:hypothetical protein